MLVSPRNAQYRRAYEQAFFAWLREQKSIKTVECAGLIFVDIDYYKNKWHNEGKTEEGYLPYQQKHSMNVNSNTVMTQSRLT